MWANVSQKRPRNPQAAKLNRYNVSVQNDVYFVGIYQLFAELMAKKHTGKDELTVAQCRLP